MRKQEPWFLWPDLYHSPAINMAIDELLLISDIDKPILRLYKWSCPAISMGYTQKISFAPKDKIIVRRLTGGGFVDHTQQYTYSIIFPKHHWINQQTTSDSYRFVNLAICEALKNMHISANLVLESISKNIDKNKMICFENPTRYDIILNGQKIAGSAQRRTKQGILHQGSIAIENLNQKKLEINIPHGISKIFNNRFVEWTCTKHFFAQVQIIAQQKYSNPNWTKKR